MLSQIKILATDTIIYGFFVIIGRFLTFLLTPFYANYMSIEAVGDIINIFSILGFLNILFTIGMDSSYFRFYDKNDILYSKKVFSISYYSILIFSIIISLLIFIFSKQIYPSITSLKNGQTLVKISAFLPLIDCMMVIPMAHLRMTRKAMKFALIRFILIIIAVTLNILFVTYYKLDAEGVLWAQFISSIIGVIILLPEIIKNISFTYDLKLLREMIRFGLPTVPATLSGMALQVADRPILKMMTNSDVVGIYGVNYRLGIPMMLFVSVFEYAWKPFYLSNYEEKDAKKLYARIFTYFTLMSASIFLIISLFIQYLIKIPFIGNESKPTLIPQQYWQGLGILPIILAGYYFNGVFNNIAAGFHIQKRTEYLPMAMIIAAIINIGMNIFFIPYFSYWASAWATLFAYLASAIILFIYSRKIYPINFEWGRLAIIILSAIIVYIICIYITKSLDDLISIVVRLFGLCLFALLLWKFKFFNREEINAIKKILKRN